MKILVKPLEGIYWDNKTLLFGCTQLDAELVLGKTQSIRGSLYYWGGELRLDFDADGKLKFIEFIGGLDSKIRPYIYDVDAFATNSEMLYRILEKENGGKIIDNENGYSYQFQSLSIGVYREATPESVAEMEAEIKSFGIDTTDNEDLKVEQQKACHWATIGIGCKRYYD